MKTSNPLKTWSEREDLNLRPPRPERESYGEFLHNACEFARPRLRTDDARLTNSQERTPGELPAAPLSARDAERFWSKVDKSAGPDACWPWTASRRNHGYGRFVVRHGVSVPAHRVAYALARQEAPGSLLVCHRCDNPPCCNPGHLFLGTMAENSADMMAKGRGRHGNLSGEDHPRARLSAQQVEFIKTQIKAGGTNTDIARAFGMSHHLISRIRRGKAWGTVPLTEKHASVRG